MRVRANASLEAESLDKDSWRSGGSPEVVLERYKRLHHVVFDEIAPVVKASEVNEMPDYKNAVQKPDQVKNRRLKMSPGGIITLPVAARKSLGMAKDQGARVTVSVEGDTVILALGGKTGGFRVSAGGQLELRAEARAALEHGSGRHYWVELLDGHNQIKLHPDK